MKKIIFSLLALCLILSSCAPHNPVRIVQKESAYPIILVKGADTTMITCIQIPLVYRISKRTFEQIETVGNPIYYYNNKFVKYDYWTGGCLPYVFKNGSFELIRRRQNIDLIGEEVIIYTLHRSKYDENSVFSQFFQPYLDRMLRENKDTLHIASIQELKKTNEDLINAFLQGDSIRFILRNDKCTIGTYSYPIEVK